MLISQREARRRLKGIIGKKLVAKLVKEHGVRIGSRTFIPAQLVEDLKGGRIPEELKGKEEVAKK